MSETEGDTEVGEGGGRGGGGLFCPKAFPITLMLQLYRRTVIPFYLLVFSSLWQSTCYNYVLWVFTRYNTRSEDTN